MVTALTQVAAREAVHVLILRQLLSTVAGNEVVLKGGVNLRLYFGSVRYSEDMDLDGQPDASIRIREGISGIFTDRNFVKDLRALGIQGLDPGEGPNKDTPTTFRYKFRVNVGGVWYPTKVEVSFREPVEADDVEITEADERVVRAYVGHQGIAVPHYGRAAAVRQKIVALVDRSHVQARDVFDLNVLTSSDETIDNDRLANFVAETVTPEVINAAYKRTFDVSFEEFQGQVLEFLAAEVRAEYESASVWDEIRLRTAEFIEAIKSLQSENKGT